MPEENATQTNIRKERFKYWSYLGKTERESNNG